MARERMLRGLKTLTSHQSVSSLGGYAFGKCGECLAAWTLKKASRGIARVFFKECAPVLAAPVCALYRYIVQRGKWPVEWKTGRATPVHKRGFKAEAKKYRPVMSLCALSIAFEEVIYDQFEAWIDSFIPLDQFGFSKHCGTDDLCLCLGSKMMATLEVRGGGLMIPLDVKGVV